MSERLERWLAKAQLLGFDHLYSIDLQSDMLVSMKIYDDFNNGITVDLPPVETIGSHAFRHNPFIREVRFCDSVRRVEWGAFEDCDRLERVVLNEGLQSIGDYAFFRCPSLTGIDIPQSVTGIGTMAFSGSGLISAAIPPSIAAIGGAAFDSCLDLESIELNEGLQRIGPYAFCGCASLAGVTIPGSVEEIGMLAFCGCDSLEEAAIPASVRTIGLGAFRNCAGLRRFSLEGGSRLQSLGAKVFEGCPRLKAIELPEDMADEGLPEDIPRSLIVRKRRQG